MPSTKIHRYMDRPHHTLVATAGIKNQAWRASPALFVWLHDEGSPLLHLPVTRGCVLPRREVRTGSASPLSCREARWQGRGKQKEARVPRACGTTGPVAPGAGWLEPCPSHCSLADARKPGSGESAEPEGSTPWKDRRPQRPRSPDPDGNLLCWFLDSGLPPCLRPKGSQGSFSGFYSCP